jgi:hypothetical protein
VYSGATAPIDKLNSKKLIGFLSVYLIDLLHRITSGYQYVFVNANG